MKEEILKFYEVELSGKKLVFMYFKGWYYFCTYGAPILLIVGTMAAVLQLDINTYLHIGIVLLIFILLTILLFTFNYKSKKILKAKYNVKFDKFMWNGVEFTNLKKQMLMKYLDSKRLLKIDKLNALIENYNKEAVDKKFNIPVIPSVFIILFIPLWNNFISWIYKQDYIITINDAVIIFMIIMFIIVIITYIIIMIKSFYETIIDDYLNTSFNKIKSLSKMLEGIKFDLEIQNINTKI